MSSRVRAAGLLIPPVRALLCVLLGALLLATVAGGQEIEEQGTGPSEGEPVDSTGVRVQISGEASAPAPPSSGPAIPWHREPRWIMLRSVVVPGWGQWANGKHLKALVVAAGEGYLISQAIDAGRLERRYRDRSRISPDGSFEERWYLAQAENEAARRRDFTWWTIFAAALSMGDAYVDAHLRGFETEFRPQEGEEGAAGFRAALRYTFP